MGWRDPVSGAVNVTVNGAPLDLRLGVRGHSPTGFEWGYLGSGPAQLALAICCHLVGEERAQAVYQRFKERIVANIPPGDHWRIVGRFALEVIERIESELCRCRSDMFGASMDDPSRCASCDLPYDPPERPS